MPKLMIIKYTKNEGAWADGADFKQYIRQHGDATAFAVMDDTVAALPKTEVYSDITLQQEGKVVIQRLGYSDAAYNLICEKHPSGNPALLSEVAGVTKTLVGAIADQSNEQLDAIFMGEWIEEVNEDETTDPNDTLE